jgi:hypothetical protein
MEASRPVRRQNYDLPKVMLRFSISDTHVGSSREVKNGFGRLRTLHNVSCPFAFSMALKSRGYAELRLVYGRHMLS